MSTNKMELIKELEYVTNYQTLGNKLMKWGKESNNEDIKLTPIPIGNQNK